jgi:hypothetical protein
MKPMKAGPIPTHPRLWVRQDIWIARRRTHRQRTPPTLLRRRPWLAPARVRIHSFVGVSGGSLAAQPLTQLALVQPGLPGEFGRRSRRAVGHCAEIILQQQAKRDVDSTSTHRALAFLSRSSRAEIFEREPHDWAVRRRSRGMPGIVERRPRPPVRTQARTAR